VSRLRPVVLTGGVALVLVAGALVWKARVLRKDLRTTRDLHGVAFVGSEACGRCHADNHQSWQRTFHRTMTAEATPASVLGVFDGSTLRHDGVVARMDRNAEAGFRMTFTRADGSMRSVTVARTVGSHRYQQYLAKDGDTYWRLPVAWHVEERRWFPMTGAFLFPDDAEIASPGRPVFGGAVFDRHVTRWNDNCVFCHNVAPNPGLDAGTGRFRTTTAELGVACEACHGPGAAHVSANADPLRRLWLWARKAPDPTIVNPARLSPSRAADVCGRCHGQRLADDVGPFMAHGDPFVPGDDLALTTAPLWRDTPLAGDREAFAARFWADGTPRLTAYEYQGLLQSRCAQQGALTCTTCHGMHEGDPRGQLRAGLRGTAADTMCTGCHAALADGAAAARHTHHDAAGTGARCVGCHMPRVVYGVLDVHRSHRVEVPDPARAAAAGRPDACTGCHVERTPRWATAARARLWGGDAPAAGDAPGLQEALFAGDAPGPQDALFAGDPLTRAVAADALGRAQVPLAPRARAARTGALLEAMASDAYPAVRHLAWRALGHLGVADAHDYDPAADGAARLAVVTRARARLGAESKRPAPALVARLRAGARAGEIEIGE
jgi:predicted CXXCH cytochrome family protein